MPAFTLENRYFVRRGIDGCARSLCIPNLKTSNAQTDWRKSKAGTCYGIFHRKGFYVRVNAGGTIITKSLKPSVPGATLFNFRKAIKREGTMRAAVAADCSKSP